MKCVRLFLGCAILLALCAIAAAAPPGSSGPATAAARNWTADNGNGTYSNPLFYEEFEDPDVIRVGEDYYLAGTTMHMNPAVQLVHSKDLVNWELAGYCTDKLDLGPAYRLEDGNIYGRGIWAPCIRYHDGMFYVFSNVNGAGLQVFRSKSISGPWERNQLPARHDLSVLFDDDGKIYIISGNNSPYPIDELAPDLKSFVPGVRHQLAGREWAKGITSTRSKASITTFPPFPAERSTKWSPRPTRSTGPGWSTAWFRAESLGVTTVTPACAKPDDRGLTLHQGGMVDTPSGEWWSIIMSDHGSAGRMVALVPITWDNDFPLIGLPGNLRKAPNTWVKPDTGYHPGSQAGFCPRRQLRQWQAQSALAVEPCSRRHQMVAHRKARCAALAFAARHRFLQRPQQHLPAATGTRVRS